MTLFAPAALLAKTAATLLARYGHLEDIPTDAADWDVTVRGAAKLAATLVSQRALYAATRNTHSAATTGRKDYEASSKKDPQAKADYLALYAKAIELYRPFISTYSDSAAPRRFVSVVSDALASIAARSFSIAANEGYPIRNHASLGPDIAFIARYVVGQFACANARGHPASQSLWAELFPGFTSSRWIQRTGGGPGGMV